MFFFRPKPPPLRSILFVCTANITRSPAAAGLFRHLVAKSGEDWVVASAGVRAVKGALPLPAVERALATRKISIGSHRSQPVTKKLIAKYRWILVMEGYHRDTIVKLDSSFADKTYVIRNFGLTTPLDSPDFPDPTFSNKKGDEALDDYFEFLKLLEIEIPRVFELLRERIVNYEMGPDND